MVPPILMPPERGPSPEPPMLPPKGLSHQVPAIPLPSRTSIPVPPGLSGKGTVLCYFSPASRAILDDEKLMSSISLHCFQENPNIFMTNLFAKHLTSRTCRIYREWGFMGINFHP